MEIRDSRLYRVEHKTFEDYCKNKWKMTASRARQLIGSSERVRNIESVTTVTPKTEAVTRPLTKLPAEQQPVALICKAFAKIETGFNPAGSFLGPASFRSGRLERRWGTRETKTPRSSNLRRRSGGTKTGVYGIDQRYVGQAWT